MIPFSWSIGQPQAQPWLFKLCALCRFFSKVGVSFFLSRRSHGHQSQSPHFHLLFHSFISFPLHPVFVTRHPSLDLPLTNPHPVTLHHWKIRRLSIQDRCPSWISFSLPFRAIIFSHLGRNGKEASFGLAGLRAGRNGLNCAVSSCSAHFFSSFLLLPYSHRWSR